MILNANEYISKIPCNSLDGSITSLDDANHLTNEVKDHSSNGTLESTEEGLVLVPSSTQETDKTNPEYLFNADAINEDENNLIGSPNIPENSIVPQVVPSVSLINLVEKNRNLEKFKEKLLSSGLEVKDVEESTIGELSLFLKEYLQFSPLACKVCARDLKNALELITRN